MAEIGTNGELETGDNAQFHFEQLRLLDLRSLQILDTESEDRFDRLTQLLADALEIPIALVSLVDERRQWFKSSCGLDQRETPRETSFCAHALSEPEMLIVPDAMLDIRFASNPLVIGEPYIRFYAGAVLHGPAGLPIGTCCIIDRRPRELDGRERKILLQVAALVERELHHTQSLAELRREVELEVFSDLTTGLANARLFRDRLAQAVKIARASQEQLAVVSIRLDGMREKAAVSAEDAAILSAATERLLPMCGRGSLLSRHDHGLAVLLTGEPREQSLTIERMATALAQPVDLGSEHLDIGAVLGVSLFPDHGASPEALIEAADAARTMRPAGGAGAIRYHDAVAAALVSSRHVLKHRLRAAIAEDELHMAYQPKVDASSGALVGAEALVRWTDPMRGPVSPLEMVAAAEGSDLIHELGSWVLRRVARQIREWDDEGLNLGPVAVNLSAAELLHPGLCPRVKSVLAEFTVEPSAIQVEITESGLVEDFAIATEHIAELRSLGVRCALDDFGTGYSSLAYLQRLRVDHLKIDRGFVTDIVVDGDTAAIVQGIIRLAHGLHLKVIAEGVETNAHARQLQTFGCDQLQGYFIAKPLPAGEYAAWVQARRHSESQRFSM